MSELTQAGTNSAHSEKGPTEFAGSTLLSHQRGACGVGPGEELPGSGPDPTNMQCYNQRKANDVTRMRRYILVFKEGTKYE